MTPVAPISKPSCVIISSRHRGASQHTCRFLRLRHQLLFEFAATKTSDETIFALSLEQLRFGPGQRVYLEHLEWTHAGTRQRHATSGWRR